MTRTDIINQLIKYYNYKDYLEIGVDQAVNIKAVNIKNKTGVDPDTKSQIYYPDVLKLTSDEFFDYWPTKFDIIFIDGLHEHHQVYRDINNALRYLNEEGTIVCHDMLPPDEACQRMPREQSMWTGDCWKAWAQIRAENENLSMFVVDTDFGCGIIKRGKQKRIQLHQNLCWISFVKNKQEWMNIISVSEFNEKFGNLS